MREHIQARNDVSSRQAHTENIGLRADRPHVDPAALVQSGCASPSGDFGRSVGWPDQHDRLTFNLATADTGLTVWQSNRIISHIRENLDLPLRAADLCGLIKLSISHFCRGFRIRFGQPVHRFVLSWRVAKAKVTMRLNPKRPLALIAADCGLADQAHLCRVFGKFVGESPGKWRRRQTTGQDNATGIQIAQVKSTRISGRVSCLD